MINEREEGREKKRREEEDMGGCINIRIRQRQRGRDNRKGKQWVEKAM